MAGNFTHYAECDAYCLSKDEFLHHEGKVNYCKLLNDLKIEGYFPGINMDLYPDRLICYLDNGNQVTLYLFTIH